MNILETDGERLLTAVRGLLEREGHRFDRGSRRSGLRSPMRPARGRGLGWSPGRGSIRRIRALDAGGRHEGGRDVGYPDAGGAAAGRAGEYRRRCITWWSARCAVAIRGRCWGIRRSGTSRRRSGRGRCAIRASCWLRNGRRCSGQRQAAGGGFDSGLSLDGAADAAGREPRVGMRRASGLGRAGRRYDRGDGAAAALRAVQAT